MADLIAIGYPDEATAAAAAGEARRLAQDLIIEPDAIASIVRDSEGQYHVHTSGTVLKASLSKDGERELQEALHGGAQ
jgi:uncharacterized membrane protein